MRAPAGSRKAKGGSLREAPSECQASEVCLPLCVRRRSGQVRVSPSTARSALGCPRRPVTSPIWGCPMGSSPERQHGTRPHARVADHHRRLPSPVTGSTRARVRTEAPVTGPSIGISWEGWKILAGWALLGPDGLPRIPEELIRLHPVERSTPWPSAVRWSPVVVAARPDPAPLGGAPRALRCPLDRPSATLYPLAVPRAGDTGRPVGGGRPSATTTDSCGMCVQ
jgi:hypothetical protein